MRCSCLWRNYRYNPKGLSSPPAWDLLLCQSCPHCYLGSASLLRHLRPVLQWDRLPHVPLWACLVCHLTRGSSAQSWLRRAPRRQSEAYCPGSFLSRTRLWTLHRAKFSEYEIYIYEKNIYVYIPLQSK